MDERELSDRPVDAAISAADLLGEGFYRYERYRVDVPCHGAGTLTRDVVRIGRVVVILAVDLDREEVILLRQFRLGAQLAIGKGDMIEVPAGRVEPGESPADAGRRECLEEIGVAPSRLVPIFEVLPSPGMSDEHMTVYLGTVDAARVPDRAGALDEHEETRPLRVPVDRALAALAAGGLRYGAAVMALQWLALHRGRLRAIAGEAAAAR